MKRCQVLALAVVAVPFAASAQFNVIEADRNASRAFQAIKECVFRELQRGAYPANVDDAMRMILVQNCRPSYTGFFIPCVATGLDIEVCISAAQAWTAASIRIDMASKRN